MSIGCAVSQDDVVDRVNSSIFSAVLCPGCIWAAFPLQAGERMITLMLYCNRIMLYLVTSAAFHFTTMTSFRTGN